MRLLILNSILALSLTLPAQAKQPQKTFWEQHGTKVVVVGLVAVAAVVVIIVCTQDKTKSLTPVQPGTDPQNHDPKKDKGDRTLGSQAQFLDKMVADKDYALQITREIGLKGLTGPFNNGFVLSFGDDGTGFPLTLKAGNKGIEGVEKIRVNHAYDPTLVSDGVLKHLRKTKTDGDTEVREHTVGFYSLSGNYLICPREVKGKSYSDVVDFAQNASDAQILSLWRHVKDAATRLKSEGKRPKLGAHTGSQGGQTEGVLHVRLDLR